MVGINGSRLFSPKTSIINPNNLYVLILIVFDFLINCFQDNYCLYISCKHNIEHVSFFLI